MDGFDLLLERHKGDYAGQYESEMSLREYLELCKVDPSAYATTAERMLKAIGEPKIIDTSKGDERLGRIHGNKVIQVYPAFEHKFFGIEEPIERLVSYFRHAAQGLEERKQVLYFLGPVGSSKSSLSEELKALLEKEPIYVLKAPSGISPVFESPLGLFDPLRWGAVLQEDFGIPTRRLTSIMSPWANKRLEEFGGDLMQFRVVKLKPSRLKQWAIAKTEPGDANNTDVSMLIGKVDIRKLELFSQNDTDAYSYSGGLNRAGQGLLEFVEMFKAPLSSLNPLLTATQEGNYNGSENIGAIPFNGIIVAHSNEAEFASFKNNRVNEAFIDRIYIVKVPYCLRVTEEERIYDKLISNSALVSAPCAPGTRQMLAQFSVLTRLKKHGNNSNEWSKMQIYDGVSMKAKDPKAKALQEYQAEAGVDEGMTGFSTRAAFKVLASTYNFDKEEVAADPIHLMMVLENAIRREQFPEETEKRYLTIVKDELAKKFAETLNNVIQKAYLESYDDYGQNLYDRYINLADSWIEDRDYMDPDTGTLMSREVLDAELSRIEKPAGIANPKDFRNDVVRYSLRVFRSTGKNPHWKDYEKFREVLEKRMFSQAADMLPIITFGTKGDSETEKKHTDFVKRMCEQGYTARQVRRLVEWYMRFSKAG
jgi:serine protein kinase